MRWVAIDKVPMFWVNSNAVLGSTSIVRATSGNWNNLSYCPAINTVRGIVAFRRWYFYSGDGPQTSFMVKSSFSPTGGTTVSCWGGNARPHWGNEYVGCDVFDEYLYSDYVCQNSSSCGSGTSKAPSAATLSTSNIPKFWIYVR